VPLGSQLITAAVQTLSSWLCWIRFHQWMTAIEYLVDVIVMVREVLLTSVTTYVSPRACTQVDEVELCRRFGAIEAVAKVKHVQLG